MEGDTSTETAGVVHGAGWQLLAAVSQPFSGWPSRSQWPGEQEMRRQVPPRQALSALGASHWTPQMPQFFGSSARTASHSFAGLRSQSAVPGEQFCKRPAVSGSGGSVALCSPASFGGLSAETVTGTRAAQLPNPRRRLTPDRLTVHRWVARATLWFASFIASLTRQWARGLGVGRA